MRATYALTRRDRTNEKGSPSTTIIPGTRVLVLAERDEDALHEAVGQLSCIHSQTWLREEHICQRGASCDLFSTTRWAETSLKRSLKFLRCATWKTAGTTAL